MTRDEERQARIAYARLQGLLALHKQQQQETDYNDRIVSVLFAARVSAKAIVGNTPDKDRQESDMFDVVKLFVNQLSKEVEKDRRRLERHQARVYY